MISVHLKKLRRRIELSSEEERAIRDCVAETRKAPAGRVVVRAGEQLNSSLLLLDGWLARCKDLPSGERQVTELHVAGDFADLHGFTLKRLDHDVMTLSECILAVVPHDRFRRSRSGIRGLRGSIGCSPMSTPRSPASSPCRWVSDPPFPEWRICSASSTHGSISWAVRARRLRAAADPARAGGVSRPHRGARQSHIQELRRRGLVELENRQLTIRDRRGLVGLAEFDPAYLYLERMPA